MIPVTQTDVEARLRRTLTAEEINQLPGEIEEASIIVEGYLGVEYTAGNPAPLAVKVVTSRVIARMVNDTGGVPANADSFSRGMGPMNVTTHLVADSTSGGPWLTKSDKMALHPYRIGGVVSIPLSREGYIFEGS